MNVDQGRSTQPGAEGLMVLQQYSVLFDNDFPFLLMKFNYSENIEKGIGRSSRQQITAI